MSTQPFNIPAADVAYRSWLQQDFTKVDPAYRNERCERAHRLEFLERQVFAREQQGADTACAHQILLETRWLIDSTANFARIDGRLKDLEAALEHSASQRFRNEQNPRDGSYGASYSEWFFQLDATYSYLRRIARAIALRCWIV